MYHESGKYVFASPLGNATDHLCEKQLFLASAQLFSGTGKINFDVNLNMYARNECSRNA